MKAFNVILFALYATAAIASLFAWVASDDYVWLWGVACWVFCILFRILVIVVERRTEAVVAGTT
jgi:hypothetical protein